MQCCAWNCCFYTQSCTFFFSITAFYHYFMEKPAGNYCFLVKSCVFSYTHRLDTIWHCMLSIFDRNVSFLSHIYSKKMLVAMWIDFMSSSSADMMEINLPAIIYENLFHFACKSSHDSQTKFFLEFAFISDFHFLLS